MIPGFPPKKSVFKKKSTKIDLDDLIFNPKPKNKHVKIEAKDTTKNLVPMTDMNNPENIPKIYDTFELNDMEYLEALENDKRS